MSGGPLRILTVCTGNLCRSPLAAALLQQRLDAVGVAATVRSAGLVTEGQTSPEEILQVAAARGLELVDHRSRLVDPAEAMESDLVLGMAREHLRSVVLASPELWSRTFTLKELVRRGREVGRRQPGQSLEAWLSSVHEGRQRAQLLGSSDLDDVDDPLGHSSSAYEETAAELEELIDSLVALAWPARAAT